jgi:hypothetical protein
VLSLSSRHFSQARQRITGSSASNSSERGGKSTKPLGSSSDHARGCLAQETPAGIVSVICLEADDPGSAMQGMGTSSDPFDEWFRERVRDIHGFDLASPPPPPEQVLDYKA